VAAYSWQCSAPQCQAQLEIIYHIPQLTKHDENLLTDTEKLRRRFEAVEAQEPARDGIRQATPIEALSRLRRYILDSLNPTHTRRAFPANNKRFMEAFGLYGDECAELLHRLGFQKNTVSLMRASYTQK
jgi:ubiquitin carboxyl-terminal hydrolase 25